MVHSESKRKGNLLLFGDFVAVETNPWFDSESGPPYLKNPPKRRVFAFGLVHRWTGQSLVSTEIKWYRINYSGQEEEYFNMLLEGVRIVSISPAMATGDNPNEIPMETVELRYEKITWKHNDGNIIFSDAWNERQSA